MISVGIPPTSKAVSEEWSPSCQCHCDWGEWGWAHTPRSGSPPQECQRKAFDLALPVFVDKTMSSPINTQLIAVFYVAVNYSESTNSADSDGVPGRHVIVAA